MALPPLASISDLASLVEDFDTSETSTDSTRAAVVLRQASAMVRHAAGQPDDNPDEFSWVKSDGTSRSVPEVAWSITLQASFRAIDNPSGLGSFTIDDYTERPGEASQLGVSLTAAELDQLSKLRPSGSSKFGGLGTISTTRSDDADATIYLPSNDDGGDHFPAFSRDQDYLVLP